jgi:hypothetical protein
MNRRDLLLVTVNVTALGLASAQAEERIGQAVVVQAATISLPTPTDARARLKPSMVVDVFEQTETSLLVRRQFNLSAKGWIRRSSVINIDAFNRVRHWTGARTVEIYSDSGDSGRSYTLKADGTFRSVHRTTEGETTDRGFLFQYRSVLWARPSRMDRRELDPWSFLFVGANGSLCNFPDEGDCPT